MSYFGVNIRKIRVTKKLSQSNFAKIFNLTRAAVGAYEEGRAEAKIDKVIEISEYFKLTLDQILKKKITVNEISNYNKVEKIIKFPNQPNNEISLILNNKIEEYIENTLNSFFLEKQPKIKLPNLKRNKNIAFEIINKNFSYIAICEKCDIETLSHSNEYIVINETGLEIVNSKYKNSKIKEIWEIIGTYKNINNSTNTKLEILNTKLDKILEIIEN